MMTQPLTKNLFANFREAFFASYRSNFWDTMYGEEYSLLDVYKMSSKKIQKARIATERIGVIFAKAIEYLRHATDEELVSDLGIPKAAVDVIRMRPLSIDSVIARVDLVEVDGDFKTFEINADTPTFIKELFEVNGDICRFFQVNDPNAGLVDQLGMAVRAGVIEGCFSIGVNPEEAHIVFTSHDEPESGEDYHTVHFLKDISSLNASYTPLHKLLIDEDGLYDENEKRIDVLYRQTYPIEYLVDDMSEDGTKSIGKMMLDLVRDGKLAIVNPPSAFLMQSKAVQAFIWEAYEEKLGLFTAEESAWIGRYFLPTYWNDEAFTSKSGTQYGSKYVRKPAFGREGDTIDIFDPKAGGMIHSEKERTYSDSLPVYQKFEALPTSRVKTLKGKINAHLLVGCFLIGGKASALGIRAASTQITNNLSYFLPICEE